MLRVSSLLLAIAIMVPLSAHHEQYAQIADGWRRTNQGWEHTRTWEAILTGSMIGASLELEPLEHPPSPLVDKIATTHPLWLASIQICACVAALSHRRRQ